MKFLALFMILFSLHGGEKTRQELLREESAIIDERSVRIAAQFYSLNEEEEIKEITQNILESEDTKAETKLAILMTGRRFFLFQYPSDGFKVKGTVSFVPHPSENPLLILLRGGNRMFGLLHPANDYSTCRNYTVLATAYRGGVSEGVDEFGGDEVIDVEHLIAYLPKLEEKLKLHFNTTPMFMLGVGRGAMEMLLSLGRSPFLQQQVGKAVSLSGLLDMQECIRDREDMLQMFIEDFGLISGVNEEEWMEKRNPLSNVLQIRKDLPILILQGTHDLRVPLSEGYHMIETLGQSGHCYEYLEFPGGDHCLYNVPERMERIADWLEK